MKKTKWYKVEYYTTLKPPKKLSEVHSTYLPRGMKSTDLVDSITVSEVKKLIKLD